VYGAVTSALMAHIRFSLGSVVSRAWREVRRCLASLGRSFPAFGESVRSDSRDKISSQFVPVAVSVFTCNDEEEADPNDIAT
jgi:hypothetical protein